MTWIKICGITNIEDARVAVDAGADALGFVFYEKSPRRVDAAQVRDIVQGLPEDIEKIGVFVNPDEEAMSRTAKQACLTAVQLHGDNENPHFADVAVERSALKLFAAICMNKPNPQGWAKMWRPDAVSAFLLDSGTSSMNGGTGKTFDWQASRESIEAIKRLGNVVLAGGLNPANVCQGLEATHPWGVDVSSGVESKPGKKDADKVRAFIKAVREADKANSN